MTCNFPVKRAAASLKKERLTVSMFVSQSIADGHFTQCRQKGIEPTKWAGCASEKVIYVTFCRCTFLQFLDLYHLPMMKQR